jgi:hypothetical protein
MEIHNLDPFSWIASKEKHLDKDGSAFLDISIEEEV